MVVVRGVEGTIVIAPVRVSGTYNGRKAAKGPGIQGVSRYEVQYGVSLWLVGDPG
jgi:hypothetical protein